MSAREIVLTSTAGGVFLNTSLTSLANSVQQCKPGVVLPVWMPQANEITRGDTIGRALVYAFGLAYMFLGVSIIADRFMAAIEVITSQEREIHVTDQNGNKQIVMVRYWNETVSNLTVL
jgi:solute carrier family 8 (sodium/calcium exchanger)